jgi:hypothetical protein
MKMLFYITVPNTSFNAAVKDGTAGAKLGRILEATKPETIYFTEHGGERGAVAVYEVWDASKIPALSEPWFLTFDAKIEVRIAMTPDDLKKSGLDSLGKSWA